MAIDQPAPADVNWNRAETRTEWLDNGRMESRKKAFRASSKCGRVSLHCVEAGDWRIWIDGKFTEVYASGLRNGKRRAAVLLTNPTADMFDFGRAGC